MMEWADRLMRHTRIRSGSPLVLLSASRRDSSVTCGLDGEPLIPRRGGWNPRQIGSTEAETLQDAVAECEAKARSAGAARVRWNLSA